MKFEKKKRRKERKIKEREQKRIKALNGEDGSSLTTGDPTSTATAGGSEDDDETHSKSSVSSSESDSKDGSPDDHDRTGGKSSSIPKQEAGDGVSSVSSRQNKTERNHYILRTAIDEKYIPSSIKNLRYAANFIFIILMLLAIIYYVIQLSLFGLINQNIKNIHNSESRLNYIIDITLRSRTLILLNNNYLVLNKTE